jgi:hypothetical protein
VGIIHIGRKILMNAPLPVPLPAVPAHQVHTTPQNLQITMLQVLEHVKDLTVLHTLKPAIAPALR